MTVMIIFAITKVGAFTVQTAMSASLGSTTPVEYRSDMANFAAAVQQWVQEVPNASVVWLEYTPQHITPGAGVTSAGGCSSAPVPPLPMAACRPGMACRAQLLARNGVGSAS